ncbi:MAG: hypothetical protein IKX71_09320 [Bacteroidales bacterium]|nr:hypothetical protein [Bacteroidales bacterium]
MNIIVFASALHDIGSVIGRRDEALRKFAGEDIALHSCDGDLSGLENPVCFIATGGTEELFARVWKKLPQPIVLLSDGYHNSFAAAFEIASFLEQRGVEHKLVNLPLEDTDAGCDAPAAGDAVPLPNPYTEPVLKALAAQRIGLIGGASSWLISSGIDREAVTAKFGAQFIDIPISELEAEYNATPAAEATDSAPAYSREALADAERMYRALKAICQRYNLTALTIKCFDLLESCKTTSCLALARLSDEGIISGCEGDIPSLWTLIVANAMTGHPAFMANPSSSNAAAGTVDFAHCTIPLSMCNGYSLPSHFESGIGIGIAGILPEGPCNIMKIGGTSLDKVYQAAGEIVCNTHIPERCRTQIRFKFPSTAEFGRFMANRLGNHIVLYR